MWLGKTNASKCIDTNTHTPLVLRVHADIHRAEEDGKLQIELR